LAADVVGFGRLTSADEDRTLARLRALRSDLIDPTIAVHNGRVIKRTGDGALVEFRSVGDAVRCAVEVQNAMVKRNAGLAQERRIEFRIGIHLGDVVEEGDGDLMDEGVNIAARLEAVAEPGVICLSEDAYRQVGSRLNLAISDLGETRLKNIPEPIRSIRFRLVRLPRPGPTSPRQPSRRRGRRCGRDDEAYACAEAALREMPTFPLAAGVAAASAACSGRGAEAASARRRLSRINPNLRPTNLSAWLSFQRPQDAQRWAARLAKAGLP
jgi:class 3 adenylate cyclase